MSKQGTPKSIFRSSKTGKSRYTSIFNSVLQNEKLSLKERGLLVYLLSLDENWVINKTFLVSKSEDGKESVFSAFEGLVKKGYVVEVPRERQKDGRFKAVNYIVHEEPNIEFDENDYPEKNEALDTFQKQTNDFIEKSVEKTGIPIENESTIGFPASGKPGTGNPVTENTHIESNIIEKNLINLSSKVDFIFSSLLNKDISKDLESVSVREGEKEEEVDFFALTDDFIPEGIQPSKKPFVAPEREKVYKYPPFHPTAPASIRNDFEIYVDAGKQGLFEHINYNHIAWRQIKSDTNERPWDPSVIDIDFLNKTCKGAIPVKKYIGVKATKLDQSVKKEYHYINLFNYDYLAKPNVGPQLIKPIMETATDYCESYFRILKELYEKKIERKQQLRRIELNQNLPDGYEGIDNE